ncbi:MAG: hypothetical protein Q7K45_05980 [Nanoarchaeota archaeon]|nr:hypothetical protein [Nanoarchaeota archaeon]
MIPPPLFSASHLYKKKGRYDIILHVLPDSTLSKTDIETILNLASWHVDPNEKAEGYEGGRSVLISREKVATIGDVEFAALQLGGIGYRKMNADEQGNAHISAPEFFPPSPHNFMDGLSPGLNGYSYVEHGNLIHKIPKYTPLGSYDWEELVIKVNGTYQAQQLTMSNLIVPRLEAYGMYIDSHLQYKNEPFGFLVINALSTTKKRLIGELMSPLTSTPEEARTDSVVEDINLMEKINSALRFISQGLRDLHRHHKVHLSTHTSNWYMNEPAILTDWESMRELEGSVEDQALNRALDFEKPVRELVHLFKEMAPYYPDSIFADIEQIHFQSAAEAYAGEKISSHCLEWDYETVWPTLNLKLLQGWMIDVIQSEKKCL